MPNQQQFRVGADIGGTFTDLVVLTDSGEVFIQKVPTTPEDYSQAIVTALRQVLSQQHLDSAAARDIVHGTTVATNAILERKGAQTGFITTKGFRDVLEIGRLRRPMLYDLFWEKPATLVERYLRFEVNERVNAKGEVLAPLDPEEVREVLQKLAAYGIEALAVCLLHSYAAPAHEDKIREIAQELYPELYLSISSRVLPQMMEYERSSTTVINAYIGPLIKSYLVELQRQLDNLGVTAPLLLMQSSGAIMSGRTAIDLPVHILESGPTAGVVAASGLAKRRGDTDIISFDMGGTTAKASLIENGEIGYAYEYEVGGGMSTGSKLLSGAGYSLRVPSVDVSEIGAGGGSIVWLDKAGYPHVGPQSAGAMPGPVCYGLGGTEPTVTDCNVVLGYLNPSYLLGGGLPIDSASSAHALEQQMAKPLGISLLDAAHGAYALAVSNMTRAVKAVTTERGRDPRNFILYAFGGGGPLHAVELARALGIPTVVVPPFPGAFSASGLLFAEVQTHHVQSHFSLTSNLTIEVLDKIMGKLRGDAMRILSSDGFADDEVQLRYAADARYKGQSFELTIPLTGSVPDRDTIPALEQDFTAEYERTYGFKVAGEQVEVVNFRLVATGIGSNVTEFDYGVASIVGLRPDAVDAGKPRNRMAYFGSRYGQIETPVIQRGDLSRRRRHGPIIIEEYDSTIVVPPKCSAALDDFGDVIIHVGK